MDSEEGKREDMPEEDPVKLYNITPGVILFIDDYDVINTATNFEFRKLPKEQQQFYLQQMGLALLKESGYEVRELDEDD